MLNLTHREFYLLSDIHIEKVHDDNERYAMQSIMNAAASRGKGKNGKMFSVKELYDRDSALEEERNSEDIEEEQMHTQEWLSQFDLNKL